jgi:putative radical SAM enzyme (TIGR03279 family)
MRGSLYYKDDDTRLGLLHGNYVTLTNLAPGELERMVRLRVSPVNVSVHATDPALRGYMLGSPAPRGIMGELEALAAGGITINCQVVCCPGVNDGEALRRTVRDLAGLYPAVASVSVVPVGLTKHRGTLTPLRPFDACCARAVLSDMEELGETLLRELGSRLVYCADELYITAGRQLPGGAFYEGYPQLENGVGMMRLLMGQFEQACGRGALALTRGRAGERRPRRFSIATGRAAGRFINDMLAAASRRFGRVEGEVYEIRNDFFGGTVDVAGLLTGGDIIAQLRGKPLGDALLISRTMLRRGESVFLDGISLWDLEAAVGTHVRVVESDGADLLSAMLGRPGG